MGKFVAFSMAVLAVSGAGLSAAAVISVTSHTATVHLAALPRPAGISSTTAVPATRVGEVNLLLVGTDTRTGQGGAYSTQTELQGSSGAGNNDVNILLHISANHQAVNVISIPRDLELPFPACPDGSSKTTPASSQGMMNTALERGGLSCAVLTVEQLTGLSIPYAAEISFDGTSAMSTALGGVTVCLATPVIDNYTNPALRLSAGQQTLVGAEALSFLRSRHGVGDGSDLGRISNQQVFMSALVRQVLKSSTFDNPVTLYQVAKAALSNMTLSDTLANPSTLISILTSVQHVGASHIVFLQYPTKADPADINRVIPDPAAAPDLNRALVADQPVDLTGSTGVGSEQLTQNPVVAPETLSPSAATTRTPTATITLPPSVTGQTAAEQTCTKGNAP